ncbi:hypothetical protein ACSNOH_06215 [Streptomyces sp. URMC 127]|uniref:hypothetical protein n=1 Tax=Streptomyces sp. URMC 127 TaxID=3423402 RepID=UPI003F1BF2B7
MTDLRCGPPLSHGVCGAGRVVLDEVRIGYPGSGGEPGSCITAERVTLTGRVRFRAAVLGGRAFGRLPLTLSTAAVPPLPVPYVRLTGVHATGLWSRADHAVAQHAAITPQRSAGAEPSC